MYGCSVMMFDFKRPLSPQQESRLFDRYHPVGGNDDDFQESRKGQPVRKATNLEVPQKVAFSMLKNKEVQAKLSFYGLPTDGKRQVHLS